MTVRLVSLANVPNQSFVVQASGFRFVIKIGTIRSGIFVDLDVDGARVLSGSRVVAGEPLFPYEYMTFGNFIFTTLGDETPDASVFGVSQFLVYLSPEEIAVLTAEGVPASDLIPAAGVRFLYDDQGMYLTEDNGALLEEG